jgi:hypothetical protein
MKRLFSLALLLLPTIPVRVIDIPPCKTESRLPSATVVAQQPMRKARKSPSEVRNFIQNEARKYGVNPVLAIWIVDHESQFGVRMRGDSGRSRGYWMINSKYHPEVSTACADDLQCSTNWSLKEILAGKINEWTTYRTFRDDMRKGRASTVASNRPPVATPVQ